MSTLYKTKPWRELRSRVIERDANCVFAGLAGDCRGILQVHHVHPVSEGGPEIPHEEDVVLVCGRHHRMLHGFLNRQQSWRSCPHKHTSREARRLCEQRLNAAA